MVVIGTPMDFRLAYGKRFNPEAKMIQVDTDPMELGRNRDIDIPIEADAKAFLAIGYGGAVGLQGRPRRPGSAELREEEDKTRAQMEEWMASDRDADPPAAALRGNRELRRREHDRRRRRRRHRQPRLEDPAGEPAGPVVRPGPLRDAGRRHGFCMAINSVYPKKRIIMVNGDGAFGLNGFDFDTFVRFNIPVVSVIGNDRQWGQITVGQRAMYGKDRVVASILGDNCRYDKIVEGMGGHGEYVTEPDQIRPAIQRAFASGKPACVNVIMDQEPPGIMGGYEFM